MKNYYFISYITYFFFLYWTLVITVSINLWSTIECSIIIHSSYSCWTPWAPCIKIGVGTPIMFFPYKFINPRKDTGFVFHTIIKFCPAICQNNTMYKSYQTSLRPYLLLVIYSVMFQDVVHLSMPVNLEGWNVIYAA